VPVVYADATRLQLELAVTEASCGTDMIAYVMPTHGPNAGQSQELAVAMPDCGSGAGFVIVDLPFDVATTMSADLDLSLDVAQPVTAPTLTITAPSPES